MGSRTGICHLCLRHGKLTYEHIPPRRVYNHKPAILHSMWGLGVSVRHKKMPPPEVHQRGMGRHSLCEQCNGMTAHYYGEAFAEWSDQALSYTRKIGRTENRVALPFEIQPLNVIKQIATMALAAAMISDSQPLRELRRFVRIPFEQHLPTTFDIRAYLNPERPGVEHEPMMTPNRLGSGGAVLDVKTGRISTVYSEVAFPPMGYVVCSPLTDRKLTVEIESLASIRHFGHFRYREKAKLWVDLPVRNPFGPFPGTYAK